MTYFLAPALATLRAQINDLWPHRDKTSDGWIGDASHQARPSDHNPDYSAGGIVRALDIDEDLVMSLTAAGEAMPLVNALIADVRTRYVIYEGRIWAHDTQRWNPYSGVNAHRHHIHISVRKVDGHDLDGRRWALAQAVSNPINNGGSVSTPTLPGAPAPITPEDIMATIEELRQVVREESGQAVWNHILIREGLSAEAFVFLVDTRREVGNVLSGTVTHAETFGTQSLGAVLGDIFVHSRAGAASLDELVTDIVARLTPAIGEVQEDVVRDAVSGAIAGLTPVSTVTTTLIPAVDQT